MDRQPSYIDPGQFVFGLISGSLLSTIIALSTGRMEVAEMFYEEEVGEGNPDFVYSRQLQHWEPVPTELIGHSLSELSADLVTMENSLKVGGKANIRLFSNPMPTNTELEMFYADMIAAGFHSSKPTAKIIDGVPAVEMVLRKGSPIWAMLLPILPTAIIGGLIVFGITRLEAITKALIPLMLTAGGIFIVGLGLLTRKPVVEAAARYAGVRRR